MFEEISRDLLGSVVLILVGVVWALGIIIKILIDLGWIRRKTPEPGVVVADRTRCATLDDLDGYVMHTEYSASINDLLNRIKQHEFRSEKRMDKVDSDVLELKVAIAGMPEKVGNIVEHKLQSTIQAVDRNSKLLAVLADRSERKHEQHNQVQPG